MQSSDEMPPLEEVGPAALLEDRQHTPQKRFPKCDFISYAPVRRDTPHCNNMGEKMGPEIVDIFSKYLLRGLEIGPRIMQRHEHDADIAARKRAAPAGLNQSLGELLAEDTQILFNLCCEERVPQHPACSSRKEEPSRLLSPGVSR